MAYGSETLRYSPCLVGNPKEVQQCTQAPIMVTSTAALQSSIEPDRNMAEQHQWLVAPGTMDFFPGRFFEVFVADLSAKLILLTKNMVVANASIALDYTGRPLGKRENRRDKRKDCCTSHLCFSTKTVQKYATELQNRRKMRILTTIWRAIQPNS